MNMHCIFLKKNLFHYDKVALSFIANIRVIFALIMREIHTLYGDSKLGYIWSIIRTAFNIGIFWGIRSFFHARSPHGMSILCYLCLGFMIWNMISETIRKTMLAIEGNRSLLTYPQVFPLDIMIARCLVIAVTQMISMAFILVIGLIFNYSIYIQHIWLLLIAIFLTIVTGLSIGMLLSAMLPWLPSLHIIVPMVLRILFFLSGVFYSVSVFSHRVGSWLLLNPIMQLIEMARSAMSNGYVSPYYDIQYLLMVNLCVLTTGLLLERFTRRRLQA